LPEADRDLPGATSEHDRGRTTALDHCTAMARIDTDKAATILADALVMGDEAAAKRNGVTSRTIRKYRALLPSDPALSAAFRLKKSALDEARDEERLEWDRERRRFLRASIAKLEELVAKANSVEHIHPVAGAVKIVGELDIAKIVLDDEREYSADRQGSGASPPAGQAPGSQGADSLPAAVH